MPTTDAIELGAVVLAALAVLRLLRAAPVPALVALCLLAAAADAGLVSAPRPGALDRAQRELAVWQDERAATLSCGVASREAGLASDEEAIALLERHCGPR